MALSERLSYLITANGTDAIRTFEKVGKSADKELGKADARLDKLASGLTKTGAGMLAFSGVAAGALLSFANAAEDANQPQIELNNALANSPRLAGESAAAFNDLAKAIQSKTAADGDAVVSGIASLAQFNLTADQIKRLIPLVVDYAQLTGKDISSAATDVGKAVQGQGRALRAVGINLKDAGSEGENFANVVDALGEKVGGFAEREGETFSGRLQRLKNELGDVQEGLGVGVIGALESVVGPAASFSSWLGRTSPEAQKFTGHLLATGTAAIGAVGGLSLIAGQLIKMRDRFVVTEGAAAGTLTTMGKFAKGAGIATGVAGIALSLYEVAKASNEVTVNVEKMARAANDELLRTWQTAQALADAGPDNWFEGLFEGKPNVDPLGWFKKLAEGSLGTAQRMRDVVASTGEDVSDLDKILRDEAKAQRQANADANAGVDAFDGLGGSARSASRSVKTLGDRLDEAVDSAFSVSDAEAGVADAFDRLQEQANDASEARADAARRYADAVEDSARAIRDAETNLADAREDLNKQASGDRTDARRRVRDAEQRLADVRADGAESIAEATEGMKEWSPTLDEATRAGRENRDTIQDIVEKTAAVAAEMAKQKAPASEIRRYITEQLGELEKVGAQHGFNRAALEEYLAVLRALQNDPGLRTQTPGSADSLERNIESGYLSPNGLTLNVYTADDPTAIARAVLREFSLYGGRR